MDGLSQGSQRSNSGTSKHKGTSAMDVVGHNTGGEEDIRSEAIPGCSRSFMEELATAPEDEQFWSEQELGGASGGKKHAGKRLSIDVINGDSIGYPDNSEKVYW